MESKVIDIDLALPLPSRIEAGDGDRVDGVVWLHGRPLGWVGLPLLGTRLCGRRLTRSVVRLFADAILRELVRNGMATPGLEAFDIAGLLALPMVEAPIAAGSLTVAICTDGSRPENLDGCLAALADGGMQPAEVIVIWRGHPAEAARSRRSLGDTAALTSMGRQHLQERWSATAFPVRWLVEPSGDLARARCLAVESTRTPLVAFVEESVRVGPRWAATICRTFHEQPNAAMVSGSVLPDGGENEVGRLARSTVERMAWRNPFHFLSRCLRPDEAMPRRWFNPLQHGSAEAVAYRADAVKAAGGFHTVATGPAAKTGQHFDLWLRLLDRGEGVVFEPGANCRVLGTPPLVEAAAGIRGLVAGIIASLVAAAVRRPSRLPGLLLVAQWFLRTALGDLLRNGKGAARTLAWARLLGGMTGLARGCVGLLRPGFRRRRFEDVARPFVSKADSPFHDGRVVPIDLAVPVVADSAVDPPSSAVANLLFSARRLPVAELLATWRGRVLGLVSVATAFRPVTMEQVRRAAIERHWKTILLRFLGNPPETVFDIDGSTREDRVETVEEAAARTLGELLAPRVPMPVAARSSGPPDRDISIVVPSRDRPEDLRECLHAILTQRTDRRVEVIVVDNHPESGLTEPVVAEHARVRLLREPRQGSAYARNRGLLACRGTIIVCVDDDVVVPDGWLERILSPFADPSIAVVTGNIVPFRLETATERLTEACSSLSAGGEPFRVDGEWFHSSQAAIQAWDFGASANIAARSGVFGDPDVGLFEESLGPGTPVGAGEDPYFLYRVIKAGYALRYCPDAWVWHRHRRTPAGLRRQVYNYAKSAVGYYYLTGVRHGDRRSQLSLFGGLQLHYCRRLLEAVRGKIAVPLAMVLVEIGGHLAGGLAMLRSQARCRKIARDPAHPPTPSALPDRRGGANQDGGEPWAIDRDAGVATPPAGAAAAASAAVVDGPGR